jgi:hypothetical protein
MRPAVVAAGLAGLVFALLAAPGLTWLDAGELGASAWELGVAHPPGFPVFALLHKLVMLLLPFGDAAFRGNLASGLVGAAALGVTAAAARAFGAGALAAAGGALLAGASGVFLLHSLTIEVYTGAALFTAGLLWAWARLRSGGDARLAVAIAFGVGLAAGQHAELRLFAVLLALPALRAARGRARIAGAVCVAGLVGALCVLYLPLRSATHPWRDWGHPATASALWAHWTGARIRAAFAGQFGSLSWTAVRTFAGQWAAGAPVLGMLGLGGCVAAARRPGGWLVPAVWAVDALYSTALNPMGLADLQNGVPGVIAAGVAAALALDWGLRRLPGRLGWAPPAIAVAGAAALTLPDGARAGDRGEPALVRAALDEAPPETVAFVASDDFAAGLAWAQVVEGARPDVAVVVRQHAWDASSIEPVRRRVPAGLAGWAPGATLADFAVLRDGRRPVRWEWASDEDAAARPRGLGPVFPLFAPGATDDDGFERRIAALLEALGPAALDPPDARRAFGRLLQDLGRWRLQARDAARAVVALQAATALDADSAEAWNNLGTARSAAGDLAGAVAATERALALAPERTARLNLARYDLGLNDDAAARGHVEALLAADPADADGLGLRGILRARAGDLPGAADDFAAALRRDPAQPEALAGQAQLRKR